MKTSLDHLPDRARRDLARVVDILFEEFAQAARRDEGQQPRGRILRVILYGSYARGDFVDDPVGGYQSDYDILVVVARDEHTDPVEYWESAEERLVEERLTQRLAAPVGLVVHSLMEIDQQVQRGRPFFVDIVRDGIALFDTPGCEFVEPGPLAPAVVLEEAQSHFDERFENATTFLKGAEFFVSLSRPKQAAFLLHQATESLYQCFLLVATLYTPRSHNIRFLRRRAERLDPRLIEAWPRGTRIERRCFAQLHRAYVLARYSKHYKITREELDWLGARVGVLQNLVETLCKEQLETLQKNMLHPDR